MDSIKVSFRNAVFENGYMWVFDNLIQSICKIDTDNFQMEVISCYKGREKFVAEKMFLFRDKFYLVTRLSQEVLIYDRKKEGTSSAFCLQRPLSEDGLTINVAFFLYGENIYFFPKYIDKKVVCFDICKNTYFQRALLELPQDIKVNSSNLILGEFRSYKDTMWFILRGTGIYGKYNFFDEKSEFFQVEKDGQIFNSIGFDGKDLWFIADEGGTVHIGKQLIRIPDQNSYKTIYPIEEGGLFLSSDNDKLMFIARKTLEVSIINLTLDEKERKNIMGYFYCEYGSFVYLFPIMDKLDRPGTLLVLDKKDWKINRVDLKCEGYVKRCFQGRKVLLEENECINLERLLQFCSQDMPYVYEEKKEANTGKIIWEIV